MTTLLTIEVCYMILCLALAYVNYRVIAANKRVFHALNGLVHIAAWISAWLAMKDWPVVTLPFIGRLFFDVALAEMRGLPFTYVSPDPKSLLDIAERAIWKNDGRTPKLVYAAIIILINLIYLIV